MKKNNFWKKGFTLLEILVVIGIITVLMSLGAASYTTAQKKARDARKKGDLKTIQSAMEQYYSVCGYKYPTPDTGKVPSSIVCLSPSRSILSSTPLSPSDASRYNMTGDVSGSFYNISVVLESEGAGSSFLLESKQ